jgi:DNA-binding MarR family transcriptional regulator
MSNAFADEFEALFRATYRAAVRRLRDKRDRLSPETIALLDHLAAAGPLTAGELAKHIDRAPSTLSEMVDHLAGKGLLTRDRDPADARRSLIWLTDEGHSALLDARTVLDPALLAAAAASLTADQRKALIETLRALVVQLRGDVR